MSDALLRVRVAARVGRVDLDVDLDTSAGTVVVVGPNGAGKTTLLSVVLGAHSANSGRISVGDVVLYDSEHGVDVAVERRGIAYVPQDYALFPHLDVRGNLEFAVASSSMPPAERAARVDAMLRGLALDTLATRRPRTLSGGEKQRVALARALSVRPRALLLDEPLAALDAHARAEVRTFLGDYLARLQLPTILVTHDAADARALGRHVVVLEGGRVTQEGPWEELARAPATPFVEALIAS